MAANPAHAPASAPSGKRRPPQQFVSPELAEARRELRELRRAMTRSGVDPEWREIANELAEALRPYTMFREQVVRDGRIVVVTHVPGRTLTKASDALERIGRQVRIESYREVGMVPREDVEAGISPPPE